MRLNEWDAEQLEKLAEQLTIIYEYADVCIVRGIIQTLKMIIRKIKRGD